MRASTTVHCFFPKGAAGEVGVPPPWGKNSVQWCWHACVDVSCILWKVKRETVSIEFLFGASDLLVNSLLGALPVVGHNLAMFTRIKCQNERKEPIGLSRPTISDFHLFRSTHCHSGPEAV